MSRLDKNSFIELLKQKQPIIYNKVIVNDLIGKFVYLNTRHGECKIHTTNILKGNMPCILSAINKTTYFIKKAEEIYSDLYDYSLVDYKNNGTKIKIVCKKHGIFEQTPKNHLFSKTGCTSCNKENINCFSDQSWGKRGEISKDFHMYALYIIKCWDENEIFYKIGKSFRLLDTRFNNKLFPYNKEIVEIIYNKNPKEISKLERIYHNYHKEFQYTPIKTFSGKTECYSNFKKLNLNQIKNDTKK